MGNSINNIKFLGRKFLGVRNLNTTPVYDADAQAYFNANTTITSTADKNAINTFYLGLKSDGIYTKLKAMYLPIWGSAASCKWNLINPLDTNAAYRLTFSTGWTFSSGGALPNGAAYIETYLMPSTNLTIYNTHISYYSRTNLMETSNVEMGSYSGNGGNIFLLVFGRSPSNATSCQYDQTTTSNYVAVTGQTDSRGLWMSNRTSNVGNTHKLWRNGISIGTATTTGGIMLANTIWIGAINNSLGSPPAAYYSKKQCAFASIGDGLTDAQSLNFYNRVQTLMTYFGINV